MGEGILKDGIAAGRLAENQYVANFADLHPPFVEHEAFVEADRCYFCYDAPCQNACPTSIDIPLFIREILTDNPTGAAKTILSSLARKAYRRPITNADLDAPIQFYSAARALGDFDTAIRDALPTILASPKFLYRAERSPAGLAPGSIHAIGDVELASRLSFFLWGLNLFRRALADPTGKRERGGRRGS